MMDASRGRHDGTRIRHDIRPHGERHRAVRAVGVLWTRSRLRGPRDDRASSPRGPTDSGNGVAVPLADWRSRSEHYCVLPSYTAVTSQLRKSSLTASHTIPRCFQSVTAQG